MGTDFTIGAWYKPFNFDSVFAVYDPDGTAQLAIGRTIENGLPTFAWFVRMEQWGGQFTFASNPATPELAHLFPLEGIWFMM